jgi:hypothetical protein
MDRTMVNVLRKFQTSLLSLESASKAVLPEVGDEVQLLDQPGVTGTVLLS